MPIQGYFTKFLNHFIIKSQGGYTQDSKVLPFQYVGKNRYVW